MCGVLAEISPVPVFNYWNSGNGLPWNPLYGLVLSIPGWKRGISPNSGGILIPNRHFHLLNEFVMKINGIFKKKSIFTYTLLKLRIKY
jgi:hypothetical protein